jgi:CRISPR-associated protein Csm2
MSHRGEDVELRQIITDVGSAEILVKRAGRIGRELRGRETTTSQLRALFGEVRQIEAQWSLGQEFQALALRRLTLLKPKMAYRAQRERTVAPLVQELEAALDFVIAEREPERQTNYFKHFVEYFEAILAYYTANKG